jgi:RimJ/RimL family protein N-acetyltransferase
MGSCRSNDGDAFLMSEKPTGRARAQTTRVVEELEWESQLLGRRMGVLAAATEVELALEEAAARGFEFLLCKVSTAQIDLAQRLERHGFSLVETMMHYEFDCRRELPHIETPFAIRLATEADRDAAVALARSAFMGHYGRFHSDPRFTREEATRVYEEWVRSSFDGWADTILVAEDEGRVIGMVSCRRMEDRRVRISLALVEASHRYRGLARAFGIAVMRRYRDSTDTLDGPTHIRNLGVQRAYLALGWELRESTYTFHRWLS